MQEKKDIPFEVGDLVVSRELGTGKFIGCIGNMFCAEFEFGEYCFDAKGKGLHNNVSIKHIRKSRPGSAESRAIVARLARRYKKSHKNAGRTPIYVGWYRAWYENKNVDYPLADVYYTERDMLK